MTALNELRKAGMALRLEVPQSIAEDLNIKIELVAAEEMALWLEVELAAAELARLEGDIAKIKKAEEWALYLLNEERRENTRIYNEKHSLHAKLDELQNNYALACKALEDMRASIK